MGIRMIALAFVAAVLPVQAQDLSTEVVVDRTVETTLPKASPLKSVMPALLPVPAPSMTLKPADYSVASAFDPSVAYMRAPLYTGIDAPDNYRGYAWLGYFPVYNLSAAAGYRLFDSENTKAGAALSFEGNSYTSRCSDDRVSSNAVSALLYGSHVFSNRLAINLGADYTFDGLVNPGTAPEYDHQNLSIFNVDLGVNQYGEKGYFDIALRYNNFGMGKDIRPDINPGTEHYFSADAATRMRIKKDLAAGLDLGLYFVDNLSSHTLLNITPKVDMSGSTYELNLGVQVSLDFEPNVSKFHIAPDVNALWHAARYVDVYGTVGGGCRANTRAEMYRYSPFAVTAASFMPSYSPLDAVVGVRLGSFGGFGADVFGGYAIIKDKPMPQAPYDGTYAQFVYLPADIRGGFCGIALNYAYTTVADASVRFVMGPHGICGDLGDYIDRAKSELSAHVAVRPVKGWTAAADYVLRSGRRYGVDNSGLDFDMGNRSLLSLSATWAFTERCAFFVRADNILNSRALILPGLSDMGIHGLLGVDFRF